MARLRTTAIFAPATAAVMLFTGLSGPAQAAPPHFNKTVKCKQEDPDGRVVPTRIGNSELGWNHFALRHNIRKCKIVNAALKGNVDVVSGADIQYFGYAMRPGQRRVTIVVKARYAQRTADGRYKMDRGQKVGVITAYCKGMRKCPEWVNQ
ncbi:hypothetical protein [Streptomyces uncialis]|uniref:hypothetical protein n=1 Tax=Streptomyces uncialis TaxID=1048205 RepID=UPI003870ADCE|nr:hypothetical protein OG268_36880 [Streptomyces uncialis]